MFKIKEEDVYYGPDCVRFFWPNDVIDDAMTDILYENGGTVMGTVFVWFSSNFKMWLKLLYSNLKVYRIYRTGNIIMCSKFYGAF